MLHKDEGLWKGPVNQDHLRIGPFQSLRFSSSMRRKKLAGSGNEISKTIAEKSLHFRSVRL